MLKNIKIVFCLVALLFVASIGFAQSLNLTSAQIKQLEVKAHKGDTEAQFFLGGAYHFGMGIEQDYKQAKAWYEKAIQQEHAKAQYQLGELYYYGFGVKRDYALAEQWYKKAAKQGIAEAQYSLVILHNYGWEEAGFNGKTPYQVKRYLINKARIPPTHFSILDQMIIKLFARLKQEGGYIIPQKLLPDISLGAIFSKWCKENGYDTNSFPTYQHEYDDGIERPDIYARLYPNELMTAFNLQLENWIISGEALEYFSSRDVNAIEPIKALSRQIKLSKKAIVKLASN